MVRGPPKMKPRKRTRQQRCSDLNGPNITKSASQMLSEPLDGLDNPVPIKRKRGRPRKIRKLERPVEVSEKLNNTTTEPTGVCGNPVPREKELEETVIKGNVTREPEASPDVTAMQGKASDSYKTSNNRQSSPTLANVAVTESADSITSVRAVDNAKDLLIIVEEDETEVSDGLLANTPCSNRAASTAAQCDTQQASTEHHSPQVTSVEHLSPDTVSVEHVSSGQTSVEPLSSVPTSFGHLSPEQTSMEQFSPQSTSVEHLSHGLTSFGYVSTEPASGKHLSTEPTSVEHFSFEPTPVKHISSAQTSVEHVPPGWTSHENVSLPITSEENMDDSCSLDVLPHEGPVTGASSCDIGRVASVVEEEVTELTAHTSDWRCPGRPQKGLSDSPGSTVSSRLKHNATTDSTTESGWLVQTHPTDISVEGGDKRPGLNTTNIETPVATTSSLVLPSPGQGTLVLLPASQPQHSNVILQSASGQQHQLKNNPSEVPIPQRTGLVLPAKDQISQVFLNTGENTISTNQIPAKPCDSGKLILLNIKLAPVVSAGGVAPRTSTTEASQNVQLPPGVVHSSNHYSRRIQELAKKAQMAKSKSKSRTTTHCQFIQTPGTNCCRNQSSGPTNLKKGMADSNSNTVYICSPPIFQTPSISVQRVPQTKNNDTPDSSLTRSVVNMKPTLSQTLVKQGDGKPMMAVKSGENQFSTCAASLSSHNTEDISNQREPHSGSRCLATSSHLVLVGSDVNIPRQISPTDTNKLPTIFLPSHNVRFAKNAKDITVLNTSSTELCSLSSDRVSISQENASVSKVVSLQTKSPTKTSSQTKKRKSPPHPIRSQAKLPTSTVISGQKSVEEGTTKVTDPTKTKETGKVFDTSVTSSSTMIQAGKMKMTYNNHTKMEIRPLHKSNNSTALTGSMMIKAPKAQLDTHRSRVLNLVTVTQPQVSLESVTKAAIPSDTPCSQSVRSHRVGKSGGRLAGHCSKDDDNHTGSQHFKDTTPRGLMTTSKPSATAPTASVTTSQPTVENLNGVSGEKVQLASVGVFLLKPTESEVPSVESKPTKDDMVPATKTSNIRNVNSVNLKGNTIEVHASASDHVDYVENQEKSSASTSFLPPVQQLAPIPVVPANTLDSLSSKGNPEAGNGKPVLASSTLLGLKPRDRSDHTNSRDEVSAPNCHLEDLALDDSVSQPDAQIKCGDVPLSKPEGTHKQIYVADHSSAPAVGKIRVMHEESVPCPDNVNTTTSSTVVKSTVIVTTTTKLLENSEGKVAQSFAITGKSLTEVWPITTRHVMTTVQTTSGNCYTKDNTLTYVSIYSTPQPTATLSRSTSAKPQALISALKAPIKARRFNQQNELNRTMGYLPSSEPSPLYTSAPPNIQYLNSGIANTVSVPRLPLTSLSGATYSVNSLSLPVPKTTKTSLRKRSVSPAVQTLGVLRASQGLGEHSTQAQSQDVSASVTALPPDATQVDDTTPIKRLRLMCNGIIQERERELLPCHGGNSKPNQGKKSRSSKQQADTGWAQGRPAPSHQHRTIGAEPSLEQLPRSYHVSSVARESGVDWTDSSRHTMTSATAHSSVGLVESPQANGYDAPLELTTKLSQHRYSGSTVPLCEEMYPLPSPEKTVTDENTPSISEARSPETDSYLPTEKNIPQALTPSKDVYDYDDSEPTKLPPYSPILRTFPLPPRTEQASPPVYIHKKYSMSPMRHKRALIRKTSIPQSPVRTSPRPQATPLSPSGAPSVSPLSPDSLELTPNSPAQKSS